LTEYAVYMLSPGGFVLSGNTGVERLRGCKPAETINQPYGRFFTREDQQRDSLRTS
jgi:hypothetical protein